MFIILLLLLCVNADEEHIEFEPFPDYYAMLNVSHEASMKEIKSSFRKLAMKFHPDKNKTEGAEVVFQELSEAYSILGDVEKKAEYDQLFKHFYDLEHEDSDQKPPSSADEKPAEPQPWPKESSQQTKEKSQDSTKKPDDKKESANKEKPETSKKGESEDLPDDFKNLKGEHEELDDETLFKVLKFLAENDYIITKRTRRVPAQPTSEQFNQRPQHESRSRRSTESGDGHRSYTEYKTTSSGHGGYKAHGHSGHNQTGGHKGHDHAWTNAHQHKPRAEHQNSRYSQQFHGSEQVYCRSTTRWEGNVKITSKTCY